MTRDASSVDNRAHADVGSASATVPLASMQQLLDAARSHLNIEVSDLNATLSRAPTLGEGENARVPREVGRTLWDRLEARDGRSAFGVRMARALADEELYAALDWMAASSSTLRGALDTLARHARVANSGALTAVEPQPCGQLRFVLRMAPSTFPLPPSAGEMGIARVVLLARRWTRRPIVPAGVELRVPPPRSEKPYRALLGRATTFGADEDAVTFFGRDLARPLATASPSLHALARREVERASPTTAPRRALAARVSALMDTMLDEGVSPRLASCAERLDLHPRALQRSLLSEGTTARALLDERRRQRATALVREGRLPLDDVAAAVDLSDARALIRAFRRWHGVTPRGASIPR